MSTTTLAQRKLIEKLSKTKTSEEVSKIVGVSIWTVRKWKQHFAKKRNPLPQMGRPKQGALSTYSKKNKKSDQKTSSKK